MCLTFVSKCEKHLEERHFATVIQRFALLIWKSYLSGQDRQVLADSSIAKGCRSQGACPPPPNFWQISYITKSQPGGRLCRPNYHMPHQIFRPSCGPAKQIVDCRCLTENFTWKGNRCQNIWHNINKRYLFRLPYLSFSNIFSPWDCLCWLWLHL